MSCALTLELDRADRTYRFGDAITGTVQVAVSQQDHTHTLEVDLAWRTHGRGNGDRGGAVRTTLCSGSWHSGQTYRHQFRLIVPNGPATYHGHDFCVDWYLRVQATSPRDIPLEEEQVLIIPSDLEPGDALRTCSLGQPYEQPPDIHATVHPGLHALLGGTLLLGVGVAATLLGLESVPAMDQVRPVVQVYAGTVIAGCALLAIALYLAGSLLFARGDEAGSVSIAVVGAGQRPGSDRFVCKLLAAAVLLAVGSALLISTLAGIGALIAGISTALAALRAVTSGASSSRISPLEIQVCPAAVRRGSTIRCVVSGRGSRSADLAKATVVLAAHEHVISGALWQTNWMTLSRAIYEWTLPLNSGRTAGRDNCVELTAVLPVPDGAPVTFVARNNELCWTVTLRVMASGRVGWSGSYPVVVLP